MNNPIFNSIILTSVVAIVDIIVGYKKIVATYILIFFVFAAILFSFTSAKVHGDIVQFLQSDLIVNPGDSDYVNPKLPTYDKYMLHFKHAKHFHMLANDTVWYMPDNENVANAKLCFNVAIAGMLAPNNVSRIIAMTASAFTQYGLDCIDRYAETKHYLHRAIYHADLMIFYYQLYFEEKYPG